VAQDSAPTFTVIYNFTGPFAVYPNGVIADEAGNLYGTTSEGGNGGSSCRNGSFGCGVVYKLDSSGTETVLYSFTGGADGSGPATRLVRDASGNLYGTTVLGGNTGSACGSLGCGVVFKVDPTGTETVLHTFFGPDGAEPEGRLILDASGKLVGVTSSGGGPSFSCQVLSCGVVFEMDSTGQTYRDLHHFTGGADGAGPGSGLTEDSAGNFYGTTGAGGTGTSCLNGSFGCGVIFKMDSSGNETVLYNFTGGADGYAPESLIRDEAGNLYGTAGAGGNLTGVCAPSGCGVVFKLDPSGNQTVLYAFTGGADGRAPNDGLVRDAGGNLYGTTHYGGTNAGLCSVGCGVVFKVDPNGVETVLHTFSAGTDGGFPFSGLLVYKGSLYGTTGSGGSHSAGVVFAVKP
jgi:uncharacterized repeat protein (TIGR03803 family)